MKKHPKYNFDGYIFKSSEIGFTPKFAEPKDVKFILQNAVSENDLVGNSKSIYYYNIPCAFDIETTSFYRDTDGKTYDYKQRLQFDKNANFEKLGVMYVWQLGVNGYCIIGRTWTEFLNVCAEIVAFLGLNTNKRLLIYIHNLSFEFQFICRLFEWENVFSIEVRKPLYALTKSGLEFRCSYMLSGYNLATLAKNLTKYSIKKLVGDLDYSLIRHEKTPLTDTEIMYCVNDIKIVMLYILEYIENVKNIHQIPLTKTGAVRKFCRKECFTLLIDNKKCVNYGFKNLINELQINDLNEFDALQRAFAGGFTHANANYTDSVINDVASYDFTSSYPYVMVSEKYPMTCGKRIEIKSKKQFEMLMNIDKCLCVFDIQFFDIVSTSIENPISVSKCFVKRNFADNNGRLVAATEIATTITNIDYNIIKNFYTWNDYKIGFCYVYGAEYLPTEFIKCIVSLYKKKTELKGVAGMETEYLGSKEMLNSCYGMCVTNPLRDGIVYKDGWQVNALTDSEKTKELIKHNISKNRFLYYIWGVFVTAYARRNLFTAIHELKNDYIYSDTDSVKFINRERHLKYFDDYNKLVEYKLKLACNYHGINFADVKPKTIKGKEKLLGVWDFEGVYEKFKTLGAKRYMVKEKNALTVNGVNYDYSLTVSGVNKKIAIPYLLEKYGENGIFEAFTNYLHLPPEATGKNISTYIDYETSGTIYDYLGNECEFDAKSGLHLEPTDYHLNLSVMYLQYLAKIKIPTNE